MFQNNLRGAESVVLVEGPIDAIKCDLVGGVAAMGKVITQHQIDIIQRSGIKRLYLGLDPDAFEERDNLLSKIKDIEVFQVELPRRGSEKIDLGKLSFQEAKDCILSSKKIPKGELFVWMEDIDVERRK
jgi:hypothetical protein